MTQSDLVAHAPVTLFKVLSRSDRLVGYATPKAGLRPSVINLVAAGEVICSAKASRFNDAAAAAGIRYGWCGFELAGLPRALALSSDCAVTCAASGAVLERINLTPEVLASRPQGRQALTATEVFDFAGSERCQDIRWIMPFAIDHRNRRGIHSVIEATWQMLLDRLPDAEEIELWHSILQTDAGLGELLETLIKEIAEAAPAAVRLPGPFHPLFRYDRTLLS